MEWIVILGGILTATSLVSAYGLVYDKKIKRANAKISDGELLKLMTQLGNFTTQDLANNSNLTKEEAYLRVQILSFLGVFRVFYDSSGLSQMYNLKNSVNLDTLPIIEGKITENEIIQIAQNNGGNISAVALCIAANISFKEAKKYIKNFKNSGLLEVHYNQSLEKIYVISKQKQQNTKALINTKPQIESKNDLRDAAVIQLAVETKGKLTPTILCLKKDISVEKAKKILDDLHDKGVFEIRVSENGTIEYWLNDIDLLDTTK